MEALCFTEKWDQRNVLNFILYDLYFEKLENVNICFVTLETQNCCSWTRDDTPPCAAGRFRAWRVAGGGWRLTGDGWRVAVGGWGVAGDGWRVTGGGLKIYMKIKYHNSL